MKLSLLRLMIFGSIFCMISTSVMMTFGNPKGKFFHPLSFPGGDKLIFVKTQEPNEKAFSIHIPKGWITEGGIQRYNPDAMGGAAQSIDAKLDFKVKKDKAGQVMIHWLPELMYFDMTGNMVASMFPNGSSYNGMIVMPRMDASTFISRVVFPYIHPKATGMKIIENKKSPKMAAAIKKSDPVLPFQSTYDAAVVMFEYSENGIRYKEVMISAIQDFGSAGQGIWKNRSTIYARAPYNEYAGYEPVFQMIGNSVVLNMKWVAGEIQGQIQRGQIVQQTLQEIQRIEREIVDNTRRTNAEIQKDMYLTLTSQGEFINPYTKETEIGSTDYKYRWVGENGTTIYTDNPNYNPKNDEEFKVFDFKLTPVKR